MKFIKIGKHYISIDDILSVNENYIRGEPYFKDLPESGYESGERDVHYVCIVTREVVEGTSKSYLFKQGTQEAEAVLKWLEPRTRKLI